MTDILLGSNNDLVLYNGDILLIGTKEELIRQRMLNRLRAFKGTLFTNIEYGVDPTLIGAKGDKRFLDQDIKSLLTEVKGIVELLYYQSYIQPDRGYIADFAYTIETGEIVGISGLPINARTSEINAADGIWLNGVWNYSGVWKDDELWGGDEEDI